MSKSKYIKNIARFIVMNLVILAGISITNASVWTDQLDYVPGSIVTISGDNSNGAGYVAEELVYVDVTGPNGYTSSCSSQVDSSGAWLCQVVLSSDDSAVGDYTYTAVGQNVTERGTFTDAPKPTHTVKFGANGLPDGTTVPVFVTYTDPDDRYRTGQLKQFTTPNLGGSTNTKPGTNFVYVFSEHITVGSVTYGFVSALPVSGFTTGSDGGSTNVIVTYVIADISPPTIISSVEGTLGTNGWYTSDVTISWSVVDPESIVTSKTGCDQTTIITDTAGITLTCSAISIGGTNSQSVTIKRDTTSPTVIATPDRYADHNGWYNKPVTISFSGTDSTSGVENCDPAVTHSSDTTSVSVSGSCKDRAGNVGTGSYSLKYDGTTPTITGSRTPSANIYGWNNGDVTVHFDGSDSLSGVDTITQDTVVYSEGSGQSVEGTVVDKAGNSVSVVVGNINIDKTVPTIVPSAKLSDDSTYTSGTWTNKDVTVAFSCSDNGSGVDSCSLPVTKSGEGAGQSVDGTVVDKAGNTASVTFGGINIDKTPPEITGVPTTLSNSKGWYNTDVVVHFVTYDALAGIGTSPTDTLLSNEGADQSATGTAVDKAGNSASFTVSRINIDKTAPVVTINVPVDGNVYILNQNVPADWTVTDAISGIASAIGTVASGSHIDTSTIGSKTFKVTATDDADNAVEETVTYTVQYSQTSGRKILQPLQQVSDPSQLTKAYKLGSTLPVKFQLSDYNGVFIGTAKAILAVSKITSWTDSGDPVIILDSGSSNDNGNIFRYDQVAQQYIYNFNTKNLVVGTYRIVVTLDDGTQIITYFELKK